MYSHIFASMYQGTLMGRADLLLVFPCLLAHCDREGNVDLHPKAISSMTGLDEERVRNALLELESDDKESRTLHPEYGGARIVRVDDHRAWGWFVVNYAKYRDLVQAQQIREHAKIRQQEKRKRDAEASSPKVTKRHAAVTPMSRTITETSRNGDGNGDGNGDAPAGERGGVATGKRPSSVEEVREEIAKKGYHVDAEAFFSFYESNGWKVGKNPIVKWQSCLVTWEKRGNGKDQPSKTGKYARKEYPGYEK